MTAIATYVPSPEAGVLVGEDLRRPGPGDQREDDQPGPVDADPDAGDPRERELAVSATVPLTRLDAALRVGDELIWLGHCLDRLLRGLDVGVTHEDCDRVGFGRRLEPTRRLRRSGSPGSLLPPSRRLRRRPAPWRSCALLYGDRLRTSRYYAAAPPSRATAARRARRRAPRPRRNRGTTTSGKIARASFSTSGPKYRFETCVSTRSPTSASRATSAASAAVE